MVSPPPVPHLTFTGTSPAGVSYTGTAPDHWAVYRSTNDGSSYTRVGTLPATATALILNVELAWYYLQGETAGNVNYGATSNSIEFQPATTAPTLAIDGSNNLTWTWSGGDPTTWDIWNSDDGGTTWNRFDGAGGDSRAYPPVPSGFDWKIFAADFTDTQIGPDSNVVSS